ncbi:MAG: hypothetical protein CVV21_08075 [Candidatus Goldiibacteriota bacterium HGW-Goldbacteria-1]|nr:MAG: hypothetical protein CVV21_08075 [Candidatus Goldiibacteriota bacterium HGW-Goldbacteria-1]
MIKKSIFVLITILTLWQALPADAVLTDLASESVKKHQELLVTIAEKERILNTLRMNPAKASLWNFADRNRRERTVQQRSRLINEINSLNHQSDQVKLDILSQRAGLYESLKNPSEITDSLVAAINYGDKLEFERLAAYQFLDQASISLKNGSDKAELLKTIYTRQSLVINDIDAMISRLKAKNTALKAISGAFIGEIDTQIQELGEIRRKGQISQDLIKDK